MKPPVPSPRLAMVAAALALIGGPTAAQAQAYRPNPPEPPPKATSSIEATTPTQAETKEAKALTAAVFAKPAAAAHAVQKITADSQPDFAVTISKPESPLPDGFRPGGKGVEIKTPF
jgi:hypothetical protein